MAVANLTGFLRQLTPAVLTDGKRFCKDFQRVGVVLDQSVPTRTVCKQPRSAEEEDSCSQTRSDDVSPINHARSPSRG